MSATERAVIAKAYVMEYDKTRAQLLRELATGIAPEVDAATQERFDARRAARGAA